MTDVKENLEKVLTAPEITSSVLDNYLVKTGLEASPGAIAGLVDGMAVAHFASTQSTRSFRTLFYAGAKSGLGIPAGRTAASLLGRVLGPVVVVGTSGYFAYGAYKNGQKKDMTADIGGGLGILGGAAAGAAAGGLAFLGIGAIPGAIIGGILGGFSGEAAGRGVANVAGIKNTYKGIVKREKIEDDIIDKLKDRRDLILEGKVDGRLWGKNQLDREEQIKKIEELVGVKLTGEELVALQEETRKTLTDEKIEEMAKLSTKMQVRALKEQGYGVKDEEGNFIKEVEPTVITDAQVAEQYIAVVSVMFGKEITADQVSPEALEQFKRDLASKDSSVIFENPPAEKTAAPHTDLTETPEVVKARAGTPEPQAVVAPKPVPVQEPSWVDKIVNYLKGLVTSLLAIFGMNQSNDHSELEGAETMSSVATEDRNGHKRGIDGTVLAEASEVAEGLRRATKAGAGMERERLPRGEGHHRTPEAVR